MIALAVPKARTNQSILPSLRRLLDSAERATVLGPQVPAIVDAARRALAGDGTRSDLLTSPVQPAQPQASPQARFPASSSQLLDAPSYHYASPSLGVPMNSPRYDSRTSLRAGPHAPQSALPYGGKYAPSVAVNPWAGAPSSPLMSHVQPSLGLGYNHQASYTNPLSYRLPSMAPRAPHSPYAYAPTPPLNDSLNVPTPTGTEWITLMRALNRSPYHMP